MNINTLALRRCLDINSRTLGNKIIPAFNNVLFENKGSDITITTSNQINQTRTKLTIDDIVAKDSCFQVSGNDFIQTIKLIDDEEVGLKINDKSIVISTETSKYKLPIYPGKDYPLKTPIQDSDLDLPPSLVSMIAKAAGYFNPNDIRDALRGICIKKVKDKLVVMSSKSGHIAIKMELDYDGEIITSILHGSIVAAIDMFKEAPFVKISSSSNQFQISNDDYELMGTKIDVDYPSLEKMVTPPESFCIVNKLDLSKAVKRSLIYSGGQDTKSVYFEVKEGVMQLYSEHIEIAKKSLDTLSVIKCSGDMCKIKMSGSYISTVIDTIDSEFIKMRWDDKGKPLYLSQPDDDSIITMQLPMSIQHA